MLATHSTRRDERRICTGLLPSLSLVLAAIISTGAGAATITVNSTADPGTANDGKCTLREAILIANGQNTSDLGCEKSTDNKSRDRIIFSDALADSGTAGTDNQSAPAIQLDPDQPGLKITDPLIIDGSIQIADQADQGTSSTRVIVDARGSDKHPNRLFNIQADTTLKNLTLQNGYVENGNGGLILLGAMGQGPELTIHRVLLRNSAATDTSQNDGLDTGLGGAIYAASGSLKISESEIATNSAERGAGIWTRVDTVIKGSFIHDNFATADKADAQGGNIYVQQAKLTLLESTVLEGKAVALNQFDGAGGGIFMNGGTLIIKGSLLRSNFATTKGGAIALRNGATATIKRTAFSLNGLNSFLGKQVGITKKGGAIHAVDANAITLMTGSMIANAASKEGGAIWSQNTDISITGFEFQENIAQGVARIQRSNPDDSEDPDNSQDSGQGNTPEPTKVTGGDGGAIYFTGTSNDTLTLKHTRLISNRALGDQAPCNQAQCDSVETDKGKGGAIFIAGGDVTIADSTLTRNSARSVGGAIEVKAGTVTIKQSTLGGDASNDGNFAFTNPGKGGAVHIAGGGTVTIKHSIISYNTASQGGGLWNDAGGMLTVTNSTITRNLATGNGSLVGNGGGIYGSATVAFSTITRNSAGNAGGGIANPGDTVDITGSIIANNKVTADDNTPEQVEANVFATAVNGSANIIAAKAGLGPLQWLSDTLVYPLLANSKDAIDITGSGCPADDQRGVLRDDSKCDAGSFEYKDLPLVNVSRNGPFTLVTSGKQDTVILAFTLDNAADQSVTVTGFSVETLFNGSYRRLRDFLPGGDDTGQTEPYDVVIDENGNGELDPGETMIVGHADDVEARQFNLNQCNSFCVLEADGPKADDSVDLLVVLRAPANAATNGGTQTTQHMSQAPLVAGGTLLALLAVLSLTGVRRRTRLAMALAIIAIGLTACSNSDGPPPPFPPVFVNPPELRGELTFRVVALNAQSNVKADGLPVYGPAISVQ